jgi:hypothetical protein
MAFDPDGGSAYRDGVDHVIATASDRVWTKKPGHGRLCSAPLRTQETGAMQPRRHGQILWALLAALALVLTHSGCSDVKVNTMYGPGTKFTGLGTTYDWATRTLPPGQDARRVDNPDINKMVIQLVEERLTARNFTPLRTGIPDFWIDYRITAKELGDRVYGRTYEKGSLILDVVDPDSGKIIWRGVAQAKIMENATPETSEQRITYAIDEMFKTFPTQQGPGMPPPTE